MFHLHVHTGSESSDPTVGTASFGDGHILAALAAFWKTIAPIVLPIIIGLIPKSEGPASAITQQ